MQRRNSRSRGLSLIEVVVAMFIVAFGSHYIFTATMQEQSRARREIYRSQARWLAEQRMAELQVIPAEELSDWVAPVKPGVIPGNLKFEEQVTISTVNNRKLIIEITVGWNLDNGEFVDGNAVTIQTQRLL